MIFTPEQAREALDAWVCRPGMTQEQATILITEAFWALKERPNIDVQRVTFDDGAVDQRALGVNRVKIFERWKAIDTRDKREKFTALIPAIMEAIRISDFRLYCEITDGKSITYMLAGLNKEYGDVVESGLLLADPAVVERETDELSWISCSERTSGKQVIELTMLVKQLVSQLKKAKPDCKLPDRAMDYLLRNGLISVEDVLR
ncbi:toxin YdaT family protein [Escherichia coli]